MHVEGGKVCGMGMSVEEFNKQKLTGRFRYLYASDAKELGVKDVDRYAYDDDCRCLCVEFPEHGEPRILACDGGAPEDQYMTRDWQWVARELNQAYASGRLAALAAMGQHVRDETLAVKKEGE